MGVPRSVRSSPVDRTNSLSTQSCCTIPSPVASSVSSRRVRRWSSLTLSPEFAATVGSVVSAHTDAPTVADGFAPSSAPARPPSGFRGYPVLPRYARSTTGSFAVPSITTVEPSTVPDLLRPRARSASPCTARSRPLGLRYAVPTFSPSFHVLRACSAARERSVDSDTSVLFDRRSSSAPCVRSRTAPSVAVQPSAPSMIPRFTAPSQAPDVLPLDNNSRNIVVPTRSSSHRTGPIPSTGVSTSIRPSRASFVPPIHNDPGAPGEELSSNPRERIRFLCFTENNPTMSLEDFCNALHQWAFVSYFCIGAE